MTSDEPLRSALSARWRVVGYLCLASCLIWLLPHSASAQVTGGPPRIRNVYIPSDQLKVLFGSSAKGVMMPRDKILALWHDAQSHVQSQTVPPADTVLTQATFEARLDEHELHVTGRIQIAKLRGDWQTVDLPFGGLAIESAQLDGQPARFGRKDDGTLFLLLKEESRVELKLEMSVPLASKGGDLAATLKLPPVPASELLIHLDESKQLQVGETSLQADSTDNGRQMFRLAVDHTGLLPLLISNRFADGNRAPFVFVNSRSIGRIEPAGLRWQVNLDLDVYARATDSFQLQLPASVDVAEVESPQLARWTIQDRADGISVVALNFRKPFLGRRAVRLLGLAPAPLATEWDVPTVTLPEAAAHLGEVLVHSSPSLRVDVGTLAGIRPERLSPAGNDGQGNDPGSISPPGNRAGSVPAASDKPLAFAFWDENYRLPLRVIPRRRTLQVSVATLLRVDRAGVVLRSSVTVQPRYAPVFAIQLALPRDWEVTSVLSAGQPVEWESLHRATANPVANASDAVPVLQTIQFDLAKPLRPGQSLEIALTAEQHPESWLAEDEEFSELPLPELRLAGADEVEGTVLIQTPPDMELLVSDLSEDLQPVAAERSGSASVRASGTALQYRYQDDALVSGRLQIRTKPAKVSAETLAFVRLDRGELDVHYQLDLHIGQGKIRQVRFTLPAAVGNKIQVVTVASPARVIEQEPAPLSDAGDAGTGLVSWRIVLDRPLTGNLTLAVDFEMAFSAEAVDDGDTESVTGEVATPMAIPVLALQNVSRQSGIVALEAASDQQIHYVPENLRDLDPADVSSPLVYVPSQRIVAAYQYPRLPYRLTLSATRHASESVLSAVCESAEITSVTSRQGRTRHQARFSLRSLNLQHLPVTLPKDADLWSVLLDGSPVEVREKQGAYIVPLPARRANAANDARDLTLLYETVSPRSTSEGLWERLHPQTIRQSPPKIPMTTLGTTWYIHPPEGMDLVSSGGDLKPVERLTRPTLVNRLTESIAYQSTNRLPWKFGGLVVAAIVAAVIALPTKSKKASFTLLELLVVMAIIGLLIALLLPATQAAREAARRSQCSNNLKQIGLALHNYHDTYGQFPPAAIGPHDVPRERQFSWMVAILPFLEQQAFYDEIRLDLPWDHPLNAGLLQIAPSALFCPSDPAPLTSEGYPKTSYVAVTGADLTDGRGDLRGVIGLDSGLPLAEIVDGTSNTIMVAEVTDGGPWFAAGSGTARRIDDWIQNKAWSHHPGGGNCVYANGSVQFLSTDTDLQTLRHLATARGMEPMGDEGYYVEDDADYDVDSYGDEYDAEAPGKEMDWAAMEDDPAALLHAKKDQAAPLAAPKPKPSLAIPPIQRGERARLSLRLALETHGDQPIGFRREGGPRDLVIGLQDKTLARTLQWLLIATALLVAWILRRVPETWRAMAVVTGLAMPIGMAGLIPLAWTPLLDGVLLGSLAAGCLWLLPKIFKAVKSELAAPTVGAAVVTFGLLLATDASLAAEADDPGKLQNSPVQARQPDLILFIPYDRDDKPLQNTQVYLPHKEFLRLWKQAHPDKPRDVSPDVAAIVSHAEYSGRLQDDVARFDGRLLIHHFDAQWTRIELPFGEVALEKVEVNGAPATLAGARPAVSGQKPTLEKQDTPPLAEPAPAATNQPAIYLEEPGLYVVDVQFSVPVNRLGATGRMTVPLRPVSSGRLVFQLPAEDLDVQVGGGPGGWRRQAASSADESEGTATEALGRSIHVPLGDTADLSIRWQPRRVEARGDQLVSVEQSLLAEVQDSGVHLHSRFHYRIQQGTLSDVQLTVPPDVAVQEVDGLEVADWSIETDPVDNPTPGAQRLVISLKKELTTATDVNIHCFRCDPQVGDIDLQSLEPLGVVRETGRVAVGSSNRLHVRVDRADRLDQIDHAGLELPQELDGDCTLVSAYRYNSRPWRLRLQVQRLRPHVEVTDRTAVAVTARQATMRSLLTARVSRAPVASLDLRLPASLRVSQVRVPPGADWFIDRDEDGQQLKVKLSEPVIGPLDLALSGTLMRDSSEAEFVVPHVTVLHVQAQRGQLAIYLDDDLEAVLTSDRGVQPIDPASLDRTLRTDDGGQAHYAFRYEVPPENLRLRLAPAPSRLNADVVTVVSVREGGVAYISQVDFEIRQAGRSRFQVVTPQWLGDDVELQGEQVRQVRSQVTDLGRTWDIELQQPARGDYRLQLAQTLPLPGDGTVSAAVVRPLDVERSRSHLVLENLTADEINATTLDGVTTIPIDAVPEGLDESIRRQAVAAYRVSDDAANLVWQRRVREQETGLAASINLVDLTTVILEDGRYRARAAYSIRNFTLQFLELELPSDSQVWSVHVSGQPVRPARLNRQGRAITLLPLQKTSAGDFSSKVVVIYSGNLETPLRRWTQIRPPAPLILSDVPVSRTLWTVLLPREYRVSVVGRESNVDEVAAAYHQQERKLSFLDELRQMVQVASTKRKSGAGTKARANLKQVGMALQDFAQESAQVDTRNAVEFQEQAQQIGADIKRLEETKSDIRGGYGNTNLYFKQSSVRPDRAKTGGGLEGRLKMLSDEDITIDDKTTPEEARKDGQRQVFGPPIQERGKLREQAAEQLERLQTMQEAEAARKEMATPQQPAETPEGEQEEQAARLLLGVHETPPRKSSQDGRAVSDVPVIGVGTGSLSLDVDLPLVGTAYHFSKLHGQPRLVLRARHENLDRFATAVTWAALCLAMAAAAICGLRRAAADPVAYRGWPWLAAVAGTAWMFLLPAGILGLALLVAALWTLIARSRRKLSTDRDSRP